MRQGFGRRRREILRCGVIGIVTGTLLLTIGCSGTRRRGPSSANPGTDGRLRDVTISPSPGTLFISRSTIFQLSWSAEFPPPTQFTVALRRYKEERGEEPRTIDTQLTTLERIGDSYVWNLYRRDNFDLDSGGVYYLELVSGGETVTATYIVSNDRSVLPPSGDKSIGVHTVRRDGETTSPR